MLPFSATLLPGVDRPLGYSLLLVYFGQTNDAGDDDDDGGDDLTNRLTFKNLTSKLDFS